MGQITARPPKTVEDYLALPVGRIFPAPSA